MFLGVFAHGAGGGEALRQLRHAFPHPRHPGARNTPLVARIELRDHLMLQQLIERLGFDRIPGRIIAMFPSIPQRPPDFGRVGLRPPAVQFRKVDSPVDEDLHAACSASFPRSTRRVEPNIHPLHQALG